MGDYWEEQGEWFILKPNEEHKKPMLMCSNCAWIMRVYDRTVLYRYCPMCAYQKVRVRNATREEVEKVQEKANWRKINDRT